MAIITLTETNALLGYTAGDDTTRDALITTLIPMVQEKIIALTRNPFLNQQIYLEDSTVAFVAVDGVTAASITDSNENFVENYFVAGDYKISRSKLNDKIVTVSTVAAGTLTLASGETLITEVADNNVMIKRVEFPDGIKPDVSVAIDHFLCKKGYIVKSERLPGGYSAVYKTDKEMWNDLFTEYRRLYQ